MAITLRLPEALDRAVSAYSMRAGLSKNALVIVALRQYMEAWPVAEPEVVRLPGREEPVGRGETKAAPLSRQQRRAAERAARRRAK